MISCKLEENSASVNVNVGGFRISSLWSQLLPLFLHVLVGLFLDPLSLFASQISSYPPQIEEFDSYGHSLRILREVL